MLIDIEGGSVAAETIVPLLRSIVSSEDPVIAFGLAISGASNRSELTCASPPCSSDSTERYVRVMELSSFITYYAGVSRNLTLAVDDVARVRHEYFSTPPAVGLGDIVTVWSGYNAVVWVLSHDDFHEIVSFAGDNAATVLNDRLGLGYTMGTAEGNRPEIIAVEYPHDSGCEFMQPTTLDAQWVSPNFYVSFASPEHWGKTHPCSGLGAGVRERIHRMLPALTNDFLIRHIGIAEIPSFNHKSLLAEAYTRLKHTAQA